MMVPSSRRALQNSTDILSSNELAMSACNRMWFYVEERAWDGGGGGEEGFVWETLLHRRARRPLAARASAYGASSPLQLCVMQRASAHAPAIDDSCLHHRTLVLTLSSLGLDRPARDDGEQSVISGCATLRCSSCGRRTECRIGCALVKHCIGKASASLALRADPTRSSIAYGSITLPYLSAWDLDIAVSLN